jgi:hypothetical protein
MYGVVGVHSRHDLVFIAVPASIPLILNDNFGPSEIANACVDVRRTVGRTEKDNGDLEAAHAGDEEASKKFEPAVEPCGIAMAIGIGRVVGPGHRKPGDDDVPHRRECSSRHQ